MNKIYTPPKSDLMGGHTQAQGTRPGWVWAICLFYALSFIAGAAFFYLIFTSALPITNEQKHYFDGLRWMDWSIVAIASLLNFSAALALFLLRKITIKIWLAAILFSVASNLYTLLGSHWPQILQGLNNIKLVAGFGIKVGIYFYAKHLAARGVLK